MDGNAAASGLARPEGLEPPAYRFEASRGVGRTAARSNQPAARAGPVRYATGAFRLTDTLTLTRTDAVGGSGRLAKRLENGPLTVRELISAMIEWSDNTATNRLIALAGRERVNRTMDELEFPATRLMRVMMDSAAAADSYLKSAVPDGVEVASQPGLLDGVRSETGIVFLERRPFALAVMTAYLDRGRNPVAEVTDIVCRHFGKAANANRYGHRLR